MSLLKADTIKPVTSGGDLSLQGDSGGSAVDCLNITSAGDLNFSGNTDAKIKLPSAGGIYESDGTTPVLTESGGVVTLGSAVVVSGATGSIVKVHGTYAYSDVTGVTSAGAISGFSQALTVGTGNDIIILITMGFRRDGNAQNQYIDLYTTGGGLGAGASGHKFGDNIGYGMPWDGTTVPVSAAILDTSPTTSPTYGVFTASGTFPADAAYINLSFTFLEIKG